MRRMVLALAAAAMLWTGVATGAQAASHKSDPSCSISPNPAAVGQTYVVSATGLPTDTTLNLWMTAPSGAMTGTPLGTVASGAISLSTSSPSAGTWTYQITGTNVQKVYAGCSVLVS